MKRRQEVELFAQAMEEKLAIHDIAGGRQQWHGMSLYWLSRRLAEEALELTEKIHSGKAVEIREEAVDVANFAMMIYGNALREAVEGKRE